MFVCGNILFPVDSDKTSQQTIKASYEWISHLGVVWTKPELCYLYVGVKPSDTDLSKIHENKNNLWRFPVFSQKKLQLLFDYYNQRMLFGKYLFDWPGSSVI